MIYIFKFCAIVLGLTLPGYTFARLIHLEHSWAAAFPLSALFMVEAIIGFSIMGIPIRFISMAGALLLVVIFCHGSRSVRRLACPVQPCVAETSEIPPQCVAAILVVSVCVVASVTFRTTFFPLGGADTSFRWEGLARSMLLHQSIDFYPPVSASDYSIYFYPDGIPPLVATIYWWLYAVLGEPLPQATSISVVLQLIATMALTFYGTRHAFGPRAAWFALLTVSVTPLLINGFTIGQETGFTALSVAGQLCFAWAAVRNPRVSTVVVAALFAALGALARDYGPALALSGFAVLAWHKETRRYLPVYILIAVLGSAPWYLRSWVLAGNPFYSHRIPGGFAVNFVHAAIMDYYKEVFSFGQFDRSRWLNLFKHLLAGGILVIFVGIPYAFARWRDMAPLLIAAMLITFLWICSVGQTAGGVIYSTRVLTPAAIALSIVTGAALSRGVAAGLAQRKLVRFTAIAGLILLSAYSLVSAAIYPFQSRYFFSSAAGTPFQSVQQVMVDKLEATDFPATGVLTDSQFTAEIMKRNSRFKPVMYWNPEVEFLFDPDLDTNEIQKRLLAKNIRLVFVENEPQNMEFLSEIKFYRERDNWNALYIIPNEAAFFYFSPM